MIIRSDEEIEQVRTAAQKAAFRAEDNDDTDDAASAIYETIQWLTGNSDQSPADTFLDDEDESA